MFENHSAEYENKATGLLGQSSDDFEHTGEANPSERKKLPQKDTQLSQESNQKDEPDRALQRNAVKRDLLKYDDFSHGSDSALSPEDLKN